MGMALMRHVYGLNPMACLSPKVLHGRRGTPPPWSPKARLLENRVALIENCQKVHAAVCATLVPDGLG